MAKKKKPGHTYMTLEIPDEQLLAINKHQMKMKAANNDEKPSKPDAALDLIKAGIKATA